MLDAKAALQGHRAFFAKGLTKSVPFRAAQLKKLETAIKTNEQAILTALKRDLNKSPFEAYETEVGIVLGELAYTLKHLRAWARPKRAKTPPIHFLSSSRIYSEPYGTVLILSPWNYPFQLALTPLIGAIAAGNCALLKPSEYAPHTADILQKLLTEAFPPGYISVARGGRAANQTLLDEPFDYIFFTGSVAVGKVVMQAASRHLTPVTLELGGKSPCIVDSTADIPLAARRIAWGKFLNAGQTCVAPDYLLVQRGVKDALVQGIRENIHAFYGEDPAACEDFPRIINEKHFRRLQGLMASGTIVEGGQSSEAARRIAPTILDDVPWDSPVMQEEIFGPILPVLPFDDLQDAIAAVNSRPKPLALYHFTASAANEARVMQAVSFGGGCVNDAVIHLANPHLMFGGVGESGMGQYHGVESFKTFSHRKGVVKKSTLLDVPLRYPPFKNHLPLLKTLMKWGG